MPMKTVTLSSLLAAGALALLCGCTTSHVLVGPTRAPANPAAVRVYYAPPKHYEAIALVSADSKASFQITAQGRVDAALERAKREAASLGANGLLLKGVEPGGASVGVGLGTGHRTGATLATTAVGVSSGPLDKVVNAVAIFVSEE